MLMGLHGKAVTKKVINFIESISVSHCGILTN